MFKLLNSAIKDNSSNKDLSYGIVLFILGVVVGAWYVFGVHSSGGGGFYEATTDPYKGKLVGAAIGAVFPYGIFYGAVFALSYGIFRLGMGRFFTILCAIGFMVSALHLYNLVPSVIRGYGKVPFFMFGIFMMGLLVKFHLKRNQLFVLTAVSGLILGIGYRWIREDIVLIVLPFILAICIFQPGSLLGNIKKNILASFVFIFCFLIFAYPVLNKSTSSSSMISVVAGFTIPFDEKLGVNRPAYDWGYMFLDEYGYAISNAQPNVSDSHYVSTIVKNYPADILIRAYASVLKILDLPFAYQEAPVGINNNLIKAIYEGKGTLLGSFAGYGLIIAMIALLMISSNSIRQAIFCFLLILYFAGYPAIQFFGKHYFYMEFISWWLLGFIAHQIYIFSKRGINFNTKNDLSRRMHYRQHFKDVSISNIIIFSVIFFMLLAVPITALRKYQSNHLQNIFQKYDNAALQPLKMLKDPYRSNDILIHALGGFVPAKKGLAVEYLVAEFSGEKCSYATIWPVFRYERAPVSGRPDFSRTMRVDIENNSVKNTKVFFPLLAHEINDSPYLKGIRFKGLVLPRQQAACLRGLSRVKSSELLLNGQGTPITLTLSPSWQQEIRYQKLSVWQTSVTHTLPARLPDATVSELLHQNIMPIRPDDISYWGNTIKFKEQVWIVKGYASSQKDPYDQPLLDRTASQFATTLFAEVNISQIDTEILRTKPIFLRKGNHLIAQGKLNVGGMTLGLIKDGQSYGYVNVTERGDFSAIIAVPEDGAYTIGILNRLSGYDSMENNFHLTKFGLTEDFDILKN